MSLQTVSEQKSHGGIQGFYTHQSQATGTEMRFAVFFALASQASASACTVLLGRLDLY